VFTRNTTTGALTYSGVFKDGIGGVDGLNGAYCVTVSPDGKSVYVTGHDDNALAVFNRDFTGSRSPTGTAAFTSGTPVVIAPSAVLSDVDNTTLSSLTTPWRRHRMVWRRGCWSAACPAASPPPATTASPAP
jgi:DNA-binding beta-propeller fold protein YncE